MGKKLKVLLIGAGKFGIHHLRVLKELEKENKLILKDVVVATEKSKKKLKNEFGLESHAGLENSLLKTVDVVDITTPASTHYDLVKKCLDYTDVFVEKPLALSSEHIEELIKKAKNNNKKLMVGHIFRFNDALEELKKLTKEKRNKLRYVEGVFTDYGELPKDCGALHTFMHLFYITNHILNSSPQKAQCNDFKTFENGFEYYVNTNLKYDNLNVNLRIGKGKKERSLKLVFSDGEICCDLGKQTIQTRYGKKEKTTCYFKIEPLRSELECFFAVVNRENLYYPGGQEALDVQQVIEAIKKSADEGKTIQL